MNIHELEAGEAKTVARLLDTERYYATTSELCAALANALNRIHNLEEENKMLASKIEELRWELGSEEWRAMQEKEKERQEAEEAEWEAIQAVDRAEAEESYKAQFQEES